MKKHMNKSITKTKNRNIILTKLIHQWKGKFEVSMIRFLKKKRKT